MTAPAPSRGVRTRVPADAWWLLALVVLVGGFALWWVHQDVNSFTIQTHGDQVWVQASAQVAMQSGPFATNDHVGWFSGFNPWSYPGLGSLGFYLGAWLLGLVTDSSSNALAGLMAITAAAVAAATYSAVRLAPARRVLPSVAFFCGLSMGLSPFVLSKMGHFNVGAWYLLPTAIAVAGALQRWPSRRIHVLALGILALATVTSSVWWILVLLYFLALVLVVALLLRRGPWVRATLAMLGATVLGALLPAFLVLSNVVPGGTTNRQPWDSTIYSGSLVDLLLGSPWLADWFPRLQTLAPGASRELSAVGLVPAIAGAAALAIAVTAFLGLRGSWRRRSSWVLVVLQLVLLSFLTLGLGTLLEGVLLLAGVGSPLRGWSRLVVVVALLGMVLTAPWVSERIVSLRSRDPRLRITALGAAALVVSTVVVLDALHIVLMPPRGLPTIEELPAVEYLAEQGDCPVAQLPVGTFPDFPMGDGSPTSITYFYRGFVPYLLNPEGRWSFGAAAATESDRLMRSLPVQVDPATLATLADAGYCAVLYDRHYAEWLQGRQLQWPGMTTRGVEPAWSSERFDVYWTTR